MSDIIPSPLPEWETIRYRLPGSLVKGILWSALTLQRRSFVQDARVALAGLDPPLEVSGSENVPARVPILVVCNHYSRPRFDAWWLALAISAAVAARCVPDAGSEMSWVMTAAWTFPASRWKHCFLTPLTRWAFRRVAWIYGFIPMPAMPPAPDEVEERAQAVLETVRLARRGFSVGLAPEGMDTPDKLSEPPEGVGRFLALLVEAGLVVLPVGVTEMGGRLRVSFGPVFVPQIPPDRKERDCSVSRQVMEAIAR
ncbi:MAG: 1-acyl-sn-glycerol-3-phosphate acyltransferase, partial [Anaerolineae bacterium]